MMTRRTFGKAIGAIAAVGSTHASVVASAAPPPVSGDALCDLSAVDLAARIQKREVSARDVMTAHLARVERVNPKVNAVVTLVAERAMADAARADEMQARGAKLGPLHGLPVAHKDLVDTAGIRRCHVAILVPWIQRRSSPGRARSPYGTIRGHRGSNRSPSV